MGESFYDAVDDLGPERTPKAPEVIETSGRPVAEGGLRHPLALPHDRRTRRPTSGRVRSTATPAGKTAFASNCPSRLRSDQIVEALVEALGLPEDLMPAARRTRAGGNRGSAAKAPRREGSGPPEPPRRPPRRPAWPGRPRPGQGPGQGRPAGRTRGCSSTPSSASIRRSPTTTSSGRSPRPSS